MRKVLSATLLLLAACPAIATDEVQFNEAHREFIDAVLSGDSQRSIAAGETAIEIGREIFVPDHPQLTELQHDYAYALIKSGYIDEGREMLERSIDALIKSSGKNSPQLISAYLAMASAYSGLGKESQQLKWYKRALGLADRNFGKNSIDYANVAFQTGLRVYEESQSPIGEKYLKQALAIYETELGIASKEAGITHYQLGRLAFFRRDSRDVVRHLLKSLNAFEGDTAAAQEQRLKIHAMLVQAYEALDESDNATEHCIAIGRENQLAPDQDFVPLFTLKPQYPHTQWRNGVEGQVVLSFTVDESGFVRNPQVVEAISAPTGRRSFRSSFRDPEEHTSFESAALAALERYRFAPRFVDGVAVPSDDVTIRMEFTLVE